MKLEQQLRQLSFSGLAAALLLMVVPQQAFAMHIMEGFLPPVWALAQWLLFYPACGMDWCAYGVLCRRIIIRRYCWRCAARLFCPVRAQNSVGNGELFTSDRRWSGGYLVRARGGGDSRRGCAVVSGAIAGARRPDDAWRKRNVDGGDWPGCRLSGVENGLPCRTAPRCRRFLCAMLADLATYFVTSVQLGVAFPDPHAGATGSVVKFMGIFCLTQIPVAIAEGLLTVMIYDQLTKRQVITVQGH